MWKSIAIAAKPSITRNLGRNPPTQVLSKTLVSSTWVSIFLSSVYPTKFPHQNHRFFSQSSKLDDVMDLLENNAENSLESTLDSMNLCLDEEFVLRLLKRLECSRKHLGRFIIWASNKKEFRVTTSILDKIQELLIYFKSRRGFQVVDVRALWEFVKKISAKEINNDLLLNTEILNNYVLAFACLGDEKGLLEVFGKFEEFGCIPNGYTYYWTIKGLCFELVSDQAISVSRKMLDTGMLPEEGYQVCEIISFLCLRDGVKEALAVYLASKSNVFLKKDYERYMEESALELVYYLSKKDETVHIAHELLGDIPAEQREDDHDHFLWVIHGLCRKKDFDSAKKLLFKMIEKGLSPQVEVFDCLIECFSKAGDVEDAREILQLAELRGLTPRINSYEDLMNGYAKVGSMEEACEVLLAAKTKNIELYPVGLHTLVRGYCKVGKFEKGLEVFLELMRYGDVSNVNQYTKLTQSLSLCLEDLDQETAGKLREKMRKKGLYLPRITEGLIRVVKEFQ